METVERARGALYAFHQLTGTTVLELGRAVELLRDAGHGDWADRVETEVLGRNVIPGHWTYRIVEAYNQTHYEPCKGLEQGAVAGLAEDQDHLYEARLRAARRTPGHREHTSGPG
ncbi:hypothetical protein ACFTUC_02840 [Streptomyces sp. NPDC056944]|uniref:hypothetical protein n=1 Tax=Streptomyces sp. NPDC056944 TaxID=3345972 RepID=UPI003642D95A